MNNTLICFISHIITDKILNNFNIINSVAQKYNYDTIYCSPTTDIKCDNIDIVHLNIDTDKLFDKNNNNNTNNNVIYDSIFEKYNNYQYYWFIEYDVTINNDNLYEGWDNLFKYYHSNDSDLICSKIHRYIHNIGYMRRYPEQLLNRYYTNSLFMINKNLLWFGFFPICRISNKLLNNIKVFYEFGHRFFEYTIPTIAKYNNMKISSLTDDKFDIEIGYETIGDINRGSISWTSKDVENYKDKYPINTIIHPIKDKI